jgi:asparagine synthase (glutamine-hydrolysing)
MMERHIPCEVAQREKQGFSAPDASWFKGESIDFVKQLVRNDHARLYEFFDQTQVTNLVDDHLNGRVNRRLLIWSLCNVEMVLQSYFE